jgi:ornithine cyclodeaminase/alanine dehydrogenase-like protein (mu-crystallin family)
MSHQRKVRVLSADDVKRTLPMGEAVEIMKSAFAALSRGEAVLPPRAHIDVAEPTGTALFMPSYLPSLKRLGLKVATLFDGNQRLGLPRLQSLVMLVDGDTGSPLAILDGASLTAIRTGAASGAATSLLARESARRVAVFGAGVQGRTQLEAVCCVRGIADVSIQDPDVRAAEAFAREMSERLNVKCRVARDAADAVREADVICTATVSETPVFDDALLMPGVHINAIGSYKPHVQEIPEETVARAKIVVDHVEGALEEAGDLIVPLRKGLVTQDRVQTELGEVIAGAKPGRTSEDEITLFKSVGVGVQDLTAAAHVYDRAVELGLGVDALL